MVHFLQKVLGLDRQQPPASAAEQAYPKIPVSTKASDGRESMKSLLQGDDYSPLPQTLRQKLNKPLFYTGATIGAVGLGLLLAKTLGFMQGKK